MRVPGLAAVLCKDTGPGPGMRGVTERPLPSPGRRCPGGLGVHCPGAPTLQAHPVIKV